VHTFTNGVTLKTAGSQTITVTSNAITAATISWWPGDGNTNDISGGNNGTLVGGATYAPGLVNQAFSFAGTGDYFQAPANGLPTGNSDRTMELWVNVKSFGAMEAFFAGYGSFGSGTQTYHLGASGNTLFFSQWGGAIMGPSLQTGTWYHVAVTNVGNFVTLYLNGTAVASGTLSINTPSGTQFYMGSPGGDTTRSLDGLTDEAAVYDRALSPAEIQSIYNAGSAGKTHITITGSASVIVSPATASTVVVTGFPSAAGVPFSITVTALDSYGNVATGYTGTIHFPSADLTATLPPDTSFAGADHGVHTFTGIVARKKGTQTITVTDTLFSSISGSDVFNVP